MADNELTPEEAPGEVPAIPAEATPPAETPPVDESPDPAAMQAEIDALKAKRDKAEQDAIYWRRQKAEARKDYFTQPETPPAQATPAEQPDTQRPDPSQFDDYDKYVDALTDYKTDQKLAQWKREEAQKSQDASVQEKDAKLRQNIDKGYEKYEDFEDVAMDPGVPITPMIADILSESEIPADVAYYLGKNRPEAVKISRMTPIAAAREIAKIEVKLSAEPPPETPPNKQTTTAPAPINPISSGSATPGKPLEDMSMKEYEAEMERRGARRF